MGSFRVCVSCSFLSLLCASWNIHEHSLPHDFVWPRCVSSLRRVPRLIISAHTPSSLSPSCLLLLFLCFLFRALFPIFSRFLWLLLLSSPSSFSYDFLSLCALSPPPPLHLKQSPPMLRHRRELRSVRVMCEYEILTTIKSFTVRCMLSVLG